MAPARFSQRVVLGTIVVIVLLLRMCVSGVRAGISDTGVASDETLSTNPKARQTSITASVRDRINPTVPILVSPENNSILAQNIFGFVWKESTDDYGIAKYQLYLDGVLKFDDISTANQTTTQFTLTVSSGVLTLTPKVALTDGDHTWKITAFDANGNTADSATWNFTIDTVAPVLIVTSIDGQTVSISAQDTSTIPTSTIMLSHNEPEVFGTSEANASITLSIRSGSTVIATLDTTADGAGAWFFTLPVLPRDTLLLLQVIARDVVGNMSMIDGIPIKLPTPFIALPAPLPPIPFVPPQEAAKEITQQIITSLFPPATAKVVTEILDTITPLANSFLGLLLPLVRVLIGLSLLGIPFFTLTPGIVGSVLHAAHLLFPLLPWRKGGIVYDEETLKGVPFALVTIYSVDLTQGKQNSSSPAQSQSVIGVDPDFPGKLRQFKQVVSDGDGVYPEVLLSKGVYVLAVSHADYAYARSLEKVSGLSGSPDIKIREKEADDTVWSGERIIVSQDKTLLRAMLPMVHIQKAQAGVGVLEPPKPGMLGLRYTIARLPNSVVFTFTILMIFPLLLSPTVWNALVIAVYLVVSSRRFARGHRVPNLVGTVLEEDKASPAAFALVSVVQMNASAAITPTAGTVVEMCHTDAFGTFQTRVRPGSYMVTAIGAHGTNSEAIATEVVRSEGRAVALVLHPSM